MRILITGVAGFLGSHLCDRLLSEGNQVIGMDNLITGDMNNLSQLGNDPSFTFIKQDVANFIEIPQKLDYVLHFASPASPNPASPYGYPNLPIQTLKAGALGTHNALGVAKAHHAKFLLASTSEVYGDPLEHPQKESYWGNVNPVGPRSCYDEAKRFAEAITMAYYNFHGVDTHIVRIFNTYGPRIRMDDGRVVPNFIYQALRGEPLTVYGNGNQTRCFCYVDDLIEGIYRLMLSEEHYPVNIGSREEITVLELALIINELCANTAGILEKQTEGLGNDPQRRQPDLTRANDILGWCPTTSIRDGLQKTIAYMREQLYK